MEAPDPDLSPAGLYVHFPFCRRACFYCHFFKRGFRPPAAASWLRLLLRELHLRRDPGLRVDSVYFGGGSPSLLAAAQVGSLLEAAARSFALAPRAEVTLEANPEDLSPALLRGLRGAGVNRLSVGVQSFQERDLRFLRRGHDAAAAIAAAAMARDAGFANVSLDLMIGLPAQTARSMELNVRLVAVLRPEHVSVYILENAPLPAGAASSPERDARLYHQARRALAGLGYGHYEVSNFARPGRASRHNLKYWRMGPYAAVGPSAAGFLAGRDYRNVADLRRYGEMLESGRLPEARTRALDPAKRRVVTGLRLLEGVPASALAPFPEATEFLLGEGLLARRGGNIAVPASKILLLNEILAYFI
jgi:oxygen-independent coproporphyrinogen-3 oxidase